MKMKTRVKGIIAAAAMAVSVSFGGITASAATKEDVIAAARAAGIRSTYIAFLENYLRVNKFSPSAYDTMVEGFGNIRSYSLELVQSYFPEIESWDDVFEGGDDDSSDKNDDNNSSSTSPTKPADKNTQDFYDEFYDKLTGDEILNIMDEIINTGKELGLDVTVEQTGEKSFNLTVKDENGNVTLVMPVGKLVSTTGMQPDYDDNGFMTVSALCASLFAAGGIGAWLIARKNKAEE